MGQIQPDWSLLLANMMMVGWIIFTIAGVLVIVWLHRRAKAVSDRSGATCGQCGYIVRGLDSFECPECGADLREVGMLPPTETKTLRGRINRFLAADLVLLIVIWLLLSN